MDVLKQLYSQRCRNDLHCQLFCCFDKRMIGGFSCFHAPLAFSLVKVMSTSHVFASKISTSWLIPPNNQILQFTQVPNSSQNTHKSVRVDIAVLMKWNRFLLPGKESAEGCYGKHLLASLSACQWRWESSTPCQIRETGGRWGSWLKDLVGSAGLSDVPNRFRCCAHSIDSKILLMYYTV